MQIYKNPRENFMKYIFSFMLIGLFAFSAAAQKSNEVELSVSNIKSGTAYSAIIKKL